MSYNCLLIFSSMISTLCSHQQGTALRNIHIPSTRALTHARMPFSPLSHPLSQGTPPRAVLVAWPAPPAFGTGDTSLVLTQ